MDRPHSSGRDDASGEARLRSLLDGLHQELTQPLSTVISMAGLLQNVELQGAQAGYVDAIRSAAEGMDLALRNLRDMIAPDAAAAPAGGDEDFDLRLLVEDVAATFRILARRDALRCTVRIDDEVPSPVHGQPGLLRRLTGALLHCALDAPHGSAVQLEMTVLERSGGMARVRQVLHMDAVPDCAARLPVLQTMAAAVGGEAGARTGADSEIWAVFDLAEQDARPQSLPRPQPIEGRRVLVVDGDAAWRLVVREFCYVWGCSCSEASTGGLALESLRAAVRMGQSVDFVLLDTALDDMSAEELCRSIRANAELEGLMTVVTASRPCPGDAARMEQAGLDGYVPRPVGQRRLRDTLCLILGGRSAGRRALVTRHAVAEERKRRHRVLVVDDNETNRRVLSLMLKRGGYAHDVVDSGEAALEIMGREAYGLVFMDIEMPGMSGFETVERIRDRALNLADPDLPVVALTAHMTGGQHARYTQAGFSDVLEKPVDLHQLFRTVEKCMPKDMDEQAPALDMDGLLSQLDGDRELAREILATFAAEARTRVGECRELLRRGDVDAAGHKAHALRGMAGNIRASVMRSLAEQAEEACLRGNRDTALALCEEMPAELERIGSVAAQL